MDPHERLGIAPGASAAEIKRAFRRLAMRWHPDRSADPAALEHFKALRAAYEALIFGDDEAETAAADAPRGEDRHLDIEITVELACLGGSHDVEVVDAQPCPHCSGEGEVVLTHSRLCADCHGSGRVRHGSGLAPCTSCGGRGYRNRATCPQCDGSGTTQAGRQITVSIPPGTLAGTELRIRGAGHRGTTDAMPPGDLVLRVALAPHPLFRLDGRDLHLQRPVSGLRLLLGGTIRVPVPGGERDLDLSPGPPEARTLRIEGAGFPGDAAHTAGALVIHLAPLWPSALDDHARHHAELLDARLTASPDIHLPDLAAWQARWLGRDRRDD